MMGWEVLQAAETPVLVTADASNYLEVLMRKGGKECWEYCACVLERAVVQTLAHSLLQLGVKSPQPSLPSLE